MKELYIDPKVQEIIIRTASPLSASTNSGSMGLPPIQDDTDSDF